MEVGVIPKMEQFQDNNDIKVKQISEISSINKLRSNDAKEAFEVKSSEILAKESDKANEVEKTGEVELSKSVQQIATEASLADYFETQLPSTVFGFNESSQDFYVKVTRGDAENQYPTEEMMKLKAYMKNLSEAMLAKQQADA